MTYIVRSTLAMASIAAVTVIPATAHAQAELPREFGIDAGVMFGLGDESFTSIGIPAQKLRIGFFRNATFSIEPYGTLNYFKQEGFDDVTSINLGTGLLYHFSPDREANQVYVRPFAEMNYISGGESNTDFGIGAGLGIKVPWRERFAWRFEAALGYAFDAEATTLNLGAGVSFFDP